MIETLKYLYLISGIIYLIYVLMGVPFNRKQVRKVFKWVVIIIGVFIVIDLIAPTGPGIKSPYED